MVVQLRVIEPAPGAGALAVGFEDFWLLYPRRVARKAAAQAWARVPEELHLAVLEALYDWRRVWLARGDVQFVPHPATWLNGERWDDELPPGYARPAQRQAALRAVEPRRPMPEHVRALLAELRAKLR